MKGVRNKCAQLEPTKVPTAIDIAWSAGIFEGEGHAQNYKLKGRLTVRVTQKDPELLYRLRDWFGGSVVGQGRKCRVWLACGDRGRYFMALVYKFMTARRKAQIDAVQALDFLHGADPEHLSPSQISDLLGSRMGKPRRRSTLTPEEKKRRHYEAVVRYHAKPEIKAQNRIRSAARRAKLKFNQIGVTAADTNHERIN